MSKNHDSNYYKGSSNFVGGGYVKRCYETHPPLLIGNREVFGGSCMEPIITDADVYVGLDSSHKRTSMAYPWEKGQSFLYYIQDMHCPSDPASFTKLIDWLAEQVVSGSKVHVGCIGGHGRTGTVLSALVAVMDGNKDAIEYVRKAYCKKAVESKAQVDFLHKHFGINKVDGAKEHGWADIKVTPIKANPKVTSARSHTDHALIATPAKNRISVWGESVILDKLS